MANEEYQKEVGQRIKARRIELGMTQMDLANKIGFESKQAVSKLETGVRGIALDRLELIASALDTTVDYIMGMEKMDLISEIYDELKELPEDYLRNLLAIIRSGKRES